MYGIYLDEDNKPYVSDRYQTYGEPIVDHEFLFEDDAQMAVDLLKSIVKDDRYPEFGRWVKKFT